MVLAEVEVRTFRCVCAHVGHLLGKRGADHELHAIVTEEEAYPPSRDANHFFCLDCLNQGHGGGLNY